MNRYFTFFAFRDVLWLGMLISCFQVICVDFYVARLSFSTSPILTSAIKRPKDWKDQSFPSRYGTGADGRLGCVFVLCLMTQDLS